MIQSMLSLTSSDDRLPLTVQTTNERINAEAKNYPRRSTALLVNCQSNQAVLMTDLNEMLCPVAEGRGQPEFAFPNVEQSTTCKR